jgi:hypothetical protein
METALSDICGQGFGTASPPIEVDNYAYKQTENRKPGGYAVLSGVGSWAHAQSIGAPRPLRLTHKGYLELMKTETGEPSEYAPS